MAKIACVSIVVFLSMLAPAQASEMYVVDHWPADIDHIPCSAWAKLPNGTWVLTGTIKVGASELNDVAVKGDAAARALEKRCGGKGAK